MNKKITKVSYTRVHTLMECEYSYKLRYLDRIPTTITSALVYGTVIHRVIEYANKTELSKDDMVKMFLAEWNKEIASQKVQFYSTNDFINRVTKGKDAVAGYYDKFLKNVPPPKVNEFSFGANPEVKLGEYTLTGFIDEITHDDIVVDYKTGVKPTQNELDFDLQFTMYSYAYRQIFGKSENGLTLRHINTMKDMVTERDEADFIMLEIEVDKAVNKMNTPNYPFLRNLGRGCSRCFNMEACLNKKKKSGW